MNNVCLAHGAYWALCTLFFCCCERRIKGTVLTILGIQFSGIKYILTVVQPSPPSALYSFLKWKNPRVSEELSEWKWVYWAPWLGAHCCLQCTVQCRWVGGWEDESEYHLKVPEMLRNVAPVLWGLCCKWQGLCPVSPCPHPAHTCTGPGMCLLRLWLCNVSSSCHDEKGKCSFSFEPFLLDPYQERTLSASLGTLSLLGYNIEVREVFFKIWK